MNRQDLIPSEEYEATYCPEDDKLRLYVGRVSRDEYEFLRAEGWTSTPKQDCDFVAVWTPSREATAIQYAGFIGDEDTPPTERAADRAERFAGYQEKRLDEAAGHADRYESGPSAHGFQNKRKAERAAARHDRLGDKAADQWSKADYWQRRTAGVISHALHKSSPAVRMGRIKVLEVELRKCEKEWQEATERAQARFDAVLSVMEEAAGTREKLKPIGKQDFLWSLHNIRKMDGTPDEEKSTQEQCRRAVLVSALDSCRNSDANRAKAKEAEKGTRPAAEVAAEWLEGKTRPADWNAETGTEWTRHLKLRLAYENQMLEAQGGRAAMVEMEAGGFIGNRQITKVTKSPATGRVVSVEIEYMSETNQYGRLWSDGKGARMTKALINIERMGADIYRAPTDEERAEFAAKVAASKKAKAAAAKEKAAKGENCPLINPTDEDAERLQAFWNDKATECGWYQRNGGKPSEVLRMTQGEYSAKSSGGTYSSVGTITVCEHGTKADRRSGETISRHEVYKIRTASNGYNADRVIIITDKPQKRIPWAAVKAARDKEPTIDSLRPRFAELAATMKSRWMPEGKSDQAKLIADARYCGLFFVQSMSQFGWTEKGARLYKESLQAAETIQPQQTEQLQAA